MDDYINVTGGGLNRKEYLLWTIRRRDLAKVSFRNETGTKFSNADFQIGQISLV